MSIAPKPSFVKLPMIPPPYPCILDFFTTRFPNIGQEIWKERICCGKVLDQNNMPIHLDTPYQPGTRLYYFREVTAEPEVPFQETIVWQDKDLVVADKPHFLPVTPGGQYVNQCLLYRLRKRLQNHDLVPLHRLDLLTAGLVLFSANPQTRSVYEALFRAGRMHKIYLAVGHAPSQELSSQLMISNRLEPDQLKFLMRIVPGTPNATTKIQGFVIRPPYIFFHLQPLTGKTHQLRVHLQSIGCPIVHDPYYPHYPTLANKSENDPSRPLQLLAKKIQFVHPLTKEPREFISSQRLSLWPSDLPECIAEKE